MLEYFGIFNKGGVVLWSHETKSLIGDPVGNLLQEVLLEERKALNSYNYQNYVLKWGFLNNLDLVFVAVHLNFTQINWVDEFIEAIKSEFVNTYGPEKIIKVQDSYNFEPIYKRVLEIIEIKSRRPTQQPASKPSSSSTVVKKPESKEQTPEGDSDAEAKEVPESPSGVTPSSPSGIPGYVPRGGKEKSMGARFKESLDARLAAKRALKTPQSDSSKGKQKAEGRRLSAAVLASLDKSGKSQNTPNAGQLQAKAFGDAPKVGDTKYIDETGEDSEDEKELDDEALIARLVRGSEEKESGSKNVWGFFKGLVGQKELTQEDLKPIAQKFTDHLIQKNVATDIAEKLVESVVSTLVGKKLGTFGSMYQTVKSGLEDALTRILTPTKPVDVLSGVLMAKEHGRPYTITFCGVNGVGKSTSLSKVAAYFGSHGYKVGVAACDTFRSGAIEQLKTHCTALKLPLYQSGYGRDEAQVAADAIQYARRDGLDVLLIDTAGRMQGNESLMKGLAKLISVNDPDLVLFVGEALVGGDGCDQLINFNRALKVNSDRTHPRLIDGILLTKFDTIDDKVGAAISMTYSTGHPIVFLGVGQTYADLKRPNPKMLVKALLA